VPGVFGREPIDGDERRKTFELRGAAATTLLDRLDLELSQPDRTYVGLGQNCLTVVNDLVNSFGANAYVIRDTLGVLGPISWLSDPSITARAAAIQASSLPTFDGHLFPFNGHATIYDETNQIGTANTFNGITTVGLSDPSDQWPWVSRTVTLDSSSHQIGDIRQYDFADQWWTNHTLNIGHLGLIGEGEAVSTTAEMQRMAIHGFATPAGSPGMLSYEPQFGSAFDMSAGQFNVAWTPFNGAPTVGISDLSGGTFDTPQITSFFGGNPTGIDFNDPSLLMSISLDGWDDVTWEPLVLDLDGDGVDIVGREDSPVWFNVDGDAALERTAWAGRQLPGADPRPSRVKGGHRRISPERPQYDVAP
jgi:hypothetical protein